MINSAQLRRRQRRLISAFHRWVYASRYYYNDEEDRSEETGEDTVEETEEDIDYDY